MNDFWLNFIKMIDFFANFAFWLVLATLFYNLILIICGIPNNKKLDTISKKEVKPRTKFAILISARNEEIVIPYLIRSLLAMDYPQDMFDIFVMPITVPTILQ